jgi:hypothetical protein
MLCSFDAILWRKIMRRFRFTLVFVVAAVSSLPAWAQSNIGDTANNFFSDLQNILQGVALAAAAVSFLTLGLIYVLSTWPPVAEYKARHPELMQNVIIGLLIILFVSGGTLAGVIVF